MEQTENKGSLGSRLKADFMRRVKENKKTRWVRFAIVSLIFFAWVVWLQNPAVALAWFLLFDIYITGYIPFTFWKRSKNKAVLSIMAWVDAIVYAVVLVYFIFAFIGQNYQIPSSSLEKSLLVGDYLWVNKTLYGPRVPNTPLHFPLTQHTLPVLNCKSYIEQPQFAYHRLNGIRSIERGDIVVFNYPCGDTVTLKVQNPDYYQIKSALRRQGIEDPMGYIINHKDEFGDIVWRPVDRRENYVKRCIGLPGERLRISGDTVYIDGKVIEPAENVQFNYYFPVTRPISDDTWRSLNVRREDHGDAPQKDANTGTLYYNVPLTKKALEAVKKLPELADMPRLEREVYDLSTDHGIFPLDNKYGWTRPYMGEIWIPKKGVTLHLTLSNLPIYERAIHTYEGNKLEVRNGKIYINDTQTDYYTFKMDYYWMMGDNRDRSADSRYWGFVPEDHIVGTPIFIIISLDEDRSLFDGKIRWNRVLRDANPDKK